MKKIIGAIIVLFTLLFYIQITQFHAVDQMRYDGYVLSNNEIEDFLISDDLNTNNKRVTLLEVNQSEDIYEQMGSYYVGENKEAFNISYPMLINEQQALSFLCDEGILIDEDFKEVSVQNKTILNQGTLYDSLQRKIDDGTFIFYRTDKGIYINSFPIQIETLIGSEIIPSNSMIYFTEQDIRYYELANDHLIYHVILSVGENTRIQIKDVNYSYYDFLMELGIMEEDIQENIEVDLDDNIEEEKDKIETDSSISQPSVDENIDNSQNTTYPEENNSNDNNEENPSVSEYIEPKVQISDYTSTVYSISSHIEIEDPQKRLKSNRVTVEIWHEGRIIMRKFYKESQDFTIQGVPPESSLTIKTKYTYRNELGEYVDNELDIKEIKTKSLNVLEPIELSFKNGDIYSDHIVIQDFVGKIDKEHEGLKNINRIVLSTNQSSYELSAVQLIQFMNQEKFEIVSLNNLDSNQSIEYEFHLYDRFDNELKVVQFKGTTRTCKALPTAKLRVDKNKVNDVEMLISLENKDKVELKNYHLELRDIEDQLILEKDLNPKDKKIVFDNLAENTLIKYQLVASFDVENGKEIYQDYVLSKGQFTTASLSSLGNITTITTLQEENITSHSVLLNLKISHQLTNQQLLSMTTKMSLVLKDFDGNLVNRIELSDEQLEQLKNQESLDILIDHLDSKTRFNYSIEAIVRQADEDHVYHVNDNLATFQTLKKDAIVVLKDNRYLATRDSFSLDAIVYDPDNSVLNDIVTMSLYAPTGKILDAKSIGVVDTLSDNVVWTHYEYNDANDKMLLLRFKAKEYNNRYTNAYRKVNEELNIQGVEDKQLVVKFSSSAQGELSLKRVSVDKDKRAAYAYLDIMMSDVENVDKNRVYLRVYQEGVLVEDLSKRIYANNFNPDYGLDLRDYALTLKDNQEYVVKLEAEEWDPRLSEKVNKVYSSISIETYESLTPIFNEEEFVQLISKDPRGHYLVLNDLDFSNITINEFYGNIDFQGKSVTLNVDDDIHSLIKKNYGTIRNIDFHLLMNNKERIDSEEDKNSNDDAVGGLVLENHGTIQNIMFTFEQATPVLGEDSHDMSAYMNPRTNHGVGGLVFLNKGTIENFVIYAKDSLTLNGHGAYGIAENEGMVKNGYAYPALKSDGGRVYLDATYQNREASELKNVGVIVGINQSKGVIQQVYSLVNIVNELWQTFPVDENSSSIDEMTIGNIVGNNLGTIKNAYGYDESTVKYSLDGNPPYNNGPIVGANSLNIKNEDVYYLSNRFYANTNLNTRISNLTASDYQFHENVLNQDKAFIVEDLVAAGYFPHIILPQYFPKQPMSPLPQVSEKEAIAVQSTKVESHTDNSAIVEVELLNPGSGDVIHIEVHDIQNVEILSQRHENKRTYVRIEIKNPTRFYSGYSIKSVLARNNYMAGSNVSADYEVGDKMIDVDFYRPIASANDWKNFIVKDNVYYYKENGTYVKKEDQYENYKLTSDIDLSGLKPEESVIVVAKGIIDGQGYTVSNFRLDKDFNYRGRSNNNQTARHLIENVEGAEIKNITFDSFTGSKLSSTVGTVTQLSALFDHVFITNFYLGNDYTPTGTNISPFIREIQNFGVVTIQNCGVIDSTIDVNLKQNRVGGLYAYGTGNHVVKNSFVLNFNATFHNNLNTGGGLFGYSNLMTHDNCYASGSVNVGAGEIGGFGYSTASSYFTNCYADVDVTTRMIDETYHHVLAGFTTDTKSYQNILVLGNLTNRLLFEDIPFHRVGKKGNDKNASNVFAADFQKLNGRMDKDIITEVKNGLLSYEQLLKKETYVNEIQLGDFFDYSYVSEGYLPILKDTDGRILPYQGKGSILSESRYAKDVYLEDIKMEVLDPTSKVEIQCTLQGVPYDTKTKIKEIKFKNNDLTVLDNSLIIAPSNGQTAIRFAVKPNKGLDSYLLEEIVYEYLGHEYVLKCNEKMIMSLYKPIYSIEDWKKIEKKSNENYMIMNDLDFKDLSSDEIGYAYEFNRLVGKLDVNGNKPSIKNLHLNLDGNNLKNNEGGFIRIIQNEMKNLSFKDCSIHVKRASNYGLPYFNISSKVGFVIDVAGLAQYIDLNNIVINYEDELNSNEVFGTNVGFFSETRGHLKNIQADNIKVRGYSNVGGIVGSGLNGIIKDVKANNLLVEAVLYAGGISGYATTSEKNYVNLSVSNSTINAIPYKTQKEATCFGGIFGYGGVSNATVKDTTIDITNINSKPDTSRNIGGIVGVYGPVMKCNVDGVIINAPDSHSVGGIDGRSQHFTVQYNHIKDTKIIGKTYVGGIIGAKEHTGGYTHFGNIAENTYVEAIGENGIAGGMIGRSFNAAREYQNLIKDVEVVASGTNGIAGGLVGEMIDDVNRGSMQVYYNVINADVKAENGIAGGVVGRAFADSNKNGNSDMQIYRNMVVNNEINGNIAGGLVGVLTHYEGRNQGQLQPKYLESNIVATTVNGNNASSLVGNKNGEASFLNTWVHNSTTVNNISVSGMKDAIQVVNKDYLQQHQNYLNFGFSPKYLQLVENGNTNGIFPQLVFSNIINIGIENRPISDIANSITFNIPEDVSSSMFFSAQKANMPEVVLYSSGVDTLNIELSEVEENLYMSINHDMENVYKVDCEVISLSYDYLTPLTLTFYNGVEEKDVEINPNDYQRHIMSVDDEYYYLFDNQIKGLNQSFNGKFVHIYDGKAIDENGDIYDIFTQNKISEFNEIHILDEPISLDSFTFENQQVATYGTYSLVGNIRRDMQIFEENGKLGLVDGDLSIVKDSYFMHEIQSKRYQGVLGNDHIFYNLATSLKFPDDFKNRNIKYMTSGVNEAYTYIMFEYEDGSIYVFDYISGEVLVDEKKEIEVNFVDYLTSFFARQDSLLSLEASQVYEEKIVPLEKALIKEPIEEKNKNDGHISTNDSSFYSTSYSTLYDSSKHEYVLYKNEDLLNDELVEVKSENDKIEENDELMKKYLFTSTSMTLHKQSIPFYVLLIISLLAMGGIFYLRKRKKIDVK